MLVAGQNGVSDTANVKTDRGDVAPRLGFSATLPNAFVFRGGYGFSYFPANRGATSYLKNPPFTANYAGPTNAASTNGGLPNVRLSDGLPVPVQTPVTPGVIPPGNITGTALNFKADRAQQFNLVVEKEFRGNVISAGYVGARADQLNTIPNFNLAPPSTLSPDPAGQPTRREFAPNASIQIHMNGGKSQYDAAQFVFQRRYLAGFSLNTHYTLAHAQSYGRTAWNWREFEWSDAPLDIRHRWVLTASYALPWGQSLTGVAHGLLAGWQVNGVAYWQSGTSVTITNATPVMQTGGGDRPDLVGDPELPSDQRTTAKWFNTAAFAPHTPSTQPGTSPATPLHGPSQRRLDLSVFKDLGLGDAATLQIRAEIYNVLNVANFVNPNGAFAVGSTTFGSINSTGNAIPRQMQFAVKLIF
jgi:hypothetical protein